MVEKNDIMFNNIKKFYQAASKEFDISKILIYGSYVRGMVNENSDIDLAVILKDNRSLKHIDITTRLFLIASKIDNRIEPKCIFEHELETMEPASILAEIIRTGIEIEIN